MATSSESSHLSDAIERLSRAPDQQLRCYLVDEEQGCLRLLTPHQVAAELPAMPGDVWLDIETGAAERLRDFLEQLQLHPLVVEDCLEAHVSTRFSSYEKSLHFELPVFTGQSADLYLSVICVPGMLITIRRAAIPELDAFASPLETDVHLNEPSKAALLYTILDRLGDGVIREARRVRHELRRIALSMEHGSDRVHRDDIISTKRCLEDIAMIAEDQLYCLRGLVGTDSQALQTAGQREYLRNSIQNYETALRVLQRYESRASELHQLYLMTLQTKTESRIRTLTILSAICMPLTLIAGIYGMNFAQMPELRFAWGYPTTLTAMLMIAGGQLFFFYKRGWFR